MRHATAGHDGLLYNVSRHNWSDALNFTLNVPPVSPIVSAPPGNQNVTQGASTNIALGSFSDAGVGDGPWTVSVNWGDLPQDEVLGGFFDVAVPATINEHKILVRHR